MSVSRNEGESERLETNVTQHARATLKLKLKTHPSASVTSFSGVESVVNATKSGAVKVSRAILETSELLRTRALRVESSASSFCVSCEW